MNNFIFSKIKGKKKRVRRKKKEGKPVSVRREVWVWKEFGKMKVSSLA